MLQENTWCWQLCSRGVLYQLQEQQLQARGQQRMGKGQVQMSRQAAMRIVWLQRQRQRQQQWVV
jgi:hypothetical protein